MTKIPSILLAAALALTSAGPVGAQGRWLENRPMEVGRSHLSAAELAGDIYVAGGTGILEPLDIFELYDPIADHWIPLPALPGGREQFAMAAANGRVFVSGGFTEEAAGQPSAELWIYDANEAQWRQGPDMPAARAGHAMVAYEEQLYVIGGQGASVTAVHKFDIPDESWSTTNYKIAMPRAAASGVVLGGRVYLIGGIASGTSVLRNVEVLDLSSGAKSQAASLPAPRYGLAAAVLDGQIHVAGGATLTPRQTHFDHFVYDPDANHWRTAAPLPTPRFAAASATANGQWYVFGGGAGAGFFAPFTAADAVESFGSE